MEGFFNMVQRINATEKSFDLKMISDDILEKNLGGKGLATHLLLEDNPPGVDPLSPENHIILASGPVAGTRIWGSCRHGIFTKSPQTGLYSESYSGGSVAEYMAITGFDAIEIHGASSEPVWIEVSPEGTRFHDATDLWGLSTYETEDRIKAWLKENRPKAAGSGVVVIGPAGENLVSFAVVENDYWRSAGRTGVGAVLGSKKIKAIAFCGDKKKQIADPDLAATFSKELLARAKEDPGVNNS